MKPIKLKLAIHEYLNLKFILYDYEAFLEEKEINNIFSEEIQKQWIQKNRQIIKKMIKLGKMIR
jgi:hypothetical protein